MKTTTLTLAKKLSLLLLTTCLSISLLAPSAALARPAQGLEGWLPASPTTRVESPVGRARAPAIPDVQPRSPDRVWEPIFWRYFRWFRW
jgi:hypothetical protein